MRIELRCPKAKSTQNHALDALILCKTTIKGYDTKSSSFCKGCQPCITPDLWRKSGSTGDISPFQFDPNRLTFEYGNLRVISEKHYRCSLYRRSCHSLDEAIQDSSKARAAIELSSALAVPSKLVPVGKKPKRRCHREEKRFPAIQQHHFELHLGSPFQHYHLTETANQADVVQEVAN